MIFEIIIGIILAIALIILAANILIEILHKFGIPMFIFGVLLIYTAIALGVIAVY